LAAVAGGDAKTARKLAGQADALLEDHALTDLLSAQAAQLSGDVVDAERHYHTLADDPKTALTGFRGLMGLAQAKGDKGAAIDWARRAWSLGGKGALGDLAEQLFGLQAKAGLWTEAEQTLDEAQSRKSLPKDRVAFLKAVSITERAAHARLAGDDQQTLALARSAHKLAPGFVPAAVLAAEMLVRKHDVRGASGILAETWKLSPHPDIARAWGALWADQDPLAAFRNLSKAVASAKIPVAAHLELARLALAAKLWGQARTHLETAVQMTSGREAYRLLARLERLERQDEGKAAHWTELAASAAVPAAWVCGHCGQPSDTYNVVCPHCGEVASLSGEQV
jgi:HemY protein